MQTKIHPSLVDIPVVQEAESILRSCVHCGFCNAVCPTYQVLGDELDGPRGRIYQIKNLLEDNAISIEANQHLDRCLTCRSCETTCPSGVEYGRLIDIARGLIKVDPPLLNRVKSYLIRKIVPNRFLFGPLVTLGRILLPVIPGFLSKHIPPRVEIVKYPAVSLAVQSTNNTRESVLLLSGCVQGIATPNVNQSISYLLASLEIEVNDLENEGCCGALEYHLSTGSSSAGKDGIEKMKMLVLRLHEQLQDNAWIISSASGCGVTIKDYPTILQYEADIIEKAREVASRVLDIGEYLNRFPSLLGPGQMGSSQSDVPPNALKVAVHTPCTLQHGQKLPDLIKPLLQAEHIEFVDVKDEHLCCGSAGTYSIMQPDLSTEITSRKLRALEKNKPTTIVTANIGCQLTLQNASDMRVMHWVEFLAEQVALAKN